MNKSLKAQSVIDETINERIMALGSEIRSLQQKLLNVRRTSTDVFSPLGAHGPLLRAILAPVRLPVTTIDELLDQLGGPNRLVVYPNMDGAPSILAIGDLFDIIGTFVERCMPIESWGRFVQQTQAMVRKVGDHVPLLHQVRPVRLRAILESPERLVRRPLGQVPGFTETLPPPRDLASPTSTIYVDISMLLAILKAIQDEIAAANLVAENVQAANLELDSASATLDSAESDFNFVLSETHMSTVVTDALEKGNSELSEAADFLNQARVNLAAAQAADTQCSSDVSAATSIASCEVKQTELESRFTLVSDKQKAASTNFELLSIPEITIYVTCTHNNSCSDNEPEQGVSVTVTNQDHPMVDKQKSTSDSNGSVTFHGRFGNSSIHLHADDNRESGDHKDDIYQTMTDDLSVSWLFHT